MPRKSSRTPVVEGEKRVTRRSLRSATDITAEDSPAKASPSRARSAKASPSPAREKVVPSPKPKGRGRGASAAESKKATPAKGRGKAAKGRKAKKEDSEEEEPEDVEEQEPAPTAAGDAAVEEEEEAAPPAKRGRGRASRGSAAAETKKATPAKGRAARGRKAKKEESDEEEEVEEEEKTPQEPAKETPTPRRGRRAAAATPKKTPERSTPRRGRQAAKAKDYKEVEEDEDEEPEEQMEEVEPKQKRKRKHDNVEEATEEPEVEQAESKKQKLETEDKQPEEKKPEDGETKMETVDEPVKKEEVEGAAKEADVAIESSVSKEDKAKSGDSGEEEMPMETEAAEAPTEPVAASNAEAEGASDVPMQEADAAASEKPSQEPEAAKAPIPQPIIEEVSSDEISQDEHVEEQAPAPMVQEAAKEPDTSDYVVIEMEDVPAADSNQIAEALPKHAEPVEESAPVEKSPKPATEPTATPEAEPKPAVPESEPEPLAPESEPAAPEPKASEPEPSVLETEPAAQALDPTVVPESEPVVSESEPMVSESEAVAPDSEPSVPESEPVVQESESEAAPVQEASVAPETPAQNSQTTSSSDQPESAPPSVMENNTAIQTHEPAAQESAPIPTTNGEHPTQATTSNSISSSESHTSPANSVHKEVLFNRLFVSNPTAPVTDTSRAFSVVSYNILADCHAQRAKEQMPWISTEILSEQYRHNRIVQELQFLDADVLCLQEVAPKQFADVLQPALKQCGYEGMFVKRTDEHHDEGEATFFRTSRFTLVNNKSFCLNDLIAKDLDAGGLEESHKAAVKAYTGRPAVMLVTQLTCNTSGIVLTVGNIHVSHDRFQYPDLQCVQVACAVREVVATAGSSSNPHILVGDFNAWPETPVYQLATEGYLNDASMKTLQAMPNIPLPDGSSTSLVNLWWKGFQHTSNKLKSAYASVLGKETATSKFTSDKVFRIVDYIWTSGNSLDVAGVLRTAEATDVESGIPNSQFPSDHLSLKAQLLFK